LLLLLAMVFASGCYVGAAEANTRRCIGQLLMKPANTGCGDGSGTVVYTDGSWRSFARSFSDEPEIEANQKQVEMDEAATHARIAGPSEPADLAVTVPLRKAATRGRAEHVGG
jgi:hypothetical protein